MNISTLPIKKFTDAVTRYNSFFNSKVWQDVLSTSFNSYSLYVWDDETSDGFALTVFKKWMFSVAYIGFPIGKTILGKEIDVSTLNKLNAIKKDLNFDILRIVKTLKITGKNIFHAGKSFETEIKDLSNWKFDNLKGSLKRDVNKGLRNNILVKNAAKENSRNIYGMYHDTIIRNKGSLRYSSQYFENIVMLQNPNIHCCVAVQDDKVASFIVTIDNNKSTYYLHGGSLIDLRKYRSADVLLSQAITNARDRGMKSFNLMSSPENQTSLVTYKEKWGGTTDIQNTWDVIENPIKGRFLEVAMKLRGLV